MKIPINEVHKRIFLWSTANLLHALNSPPPHDNQKSVVSMKLFLLVENRRLGVEVERLPRMRKIRVRSPVVIDLSRKNRW